MEYRITAPDPAVCPVAAAAVKVRGGAFLIFFVPRLDFNHIKC